MDWIFRFLGDTWWLVSEMAPYLLLGFGIAGFLRTFFTEEWVRRHLGQKGLRQIIKSVVIGIPLPLCSCGVIPVAAGIRRQGGQRGAVAAFTAATPQTGVDAIAATVGILGWVFAIVRVFLAFINGIIAGLVVERIDEEGSKESQQSASGENAKAASGCCCGQESQEKSKEEGCCSTEETEPSCCHGEEEAATGKKSASRLLGGLKFGLITLPGDLFGALVVGLLLAGAISALVPQDMLTSIPGGLFGAYLGMTLISLPLYICSTGSIPMAFSFLNIGMSPGAVLIFLIAGPASNTATVTALWKLIGPRSTLGYLLSIVFTSWLAAFVVDFSGLSILINEAVHQHETHVNLFQQSMAVVLIAVLLHSQWHAWRVKA